ncbi:hypothetical protein [Sulfitobacter sp. S190]|uniref:hypothetical protein n=1 Tax=Sulfitobacter sp. S190 TaxID=2867022 RepID=UPI0021A61C59|nr:hypothetical protein [Sulfitobacter sp. S190]UWR23075.1 hypothetical protein K3756_03495 [Sulfitobacter sp. S190]
MATIEVPALEKGVVRLFAVSRPIPDMTKALRDGDKSAIIDELLGHEIKDGGAELFPVSDLTGVGLRSYLVEGYDIAPDELARDRSKLEALDGYVLLLFSSGLDGRKATLTPHSDLTLIGTYAEQMPDRTAAPLKTDTAAPYSGESAAEPAPVSRSGPGGRVLVAIGIVLAILLWWILT